MKKQGRPTKLTTELQEQILRGLRLGNFIATMCSFLTLDKSTFYEWIKRGEREQEGIYTDFKMAVDKAQAEAEAKLLMQISNSATSDWMASAWKLERKYASRYALRGCDGADGS